MRLTEEELEKVAGSGSDTAMVGVRDGFIEFVPSELASELLSLRQAAPASLDRNVLAAQFTAAALPGLLALPSNSAVKIAALKVIAVDVGFLVADELLRRIGEEKG
jgi:cellobiose-specific phosphotransferase system component IIC